MLKGVLFGLGVVVVTALFALVIWAGVAVAQGRTCRAQEELATKDYYDGEIDCKVGPAMRKAVRRFQRDNGIHVDGEVGEDTWCKLTGQCPDVRADEDDHKAPPVVEAPDERESERGDVSAICKVAAIDEISKAMWFETWAKNGARANWARKAQFLHGETYANPVNARIVKDECEPLPVGLKKKYRCHFVAFPCRADR